MPRLYVALLTLVLGLGAQSATAARGVEVVIDGPIGPATSRYVESALSDAAANDAELAILRIDTPGGLDQSMRDIVKAILGSDIPIIGYVSPSGARAASAGTYILYATHIAAMAPATNLGAATPVSLGGGSGSPLPGGGKPSGDETDKADEKTESSEAPKDDSDSEGVPANADAKRQKVVNDAVAYIRGLAERRGRNADWAEKAVREGASLSAEAALEKNVIDLIAPNLGTLLQDVDGRTVELAAGDRKLTSAGLEIERVEPDWRTKLLSVITNPTVAYILMMIGIYGLILEGYNPGTLVPGTIGAICLLLALFAFQVLPVNYAGLALLLLGIALMVGEAFAPSFGVLGMGGVAAFVFGSILLMDTDVPGYEVPIAIISAVGTAGALGMLLIVFLFTSSRRHRIVTGHEGLVGADAEALEDFDDAGRVFVHGESWRARAEAPVRKGQSVRITAVDGLTLTVKPR